MLPLCLRLPPELPAMAGAGTTNKQKGAFYACKEQRSAPFDGFASLHNSPKRSCRVSGRGFFLLVVWRALIICFFLNIQNNNKTS